MIHWPFQLAFHFSDATKLPVSGVALTSSGVLIAFDKEQFHNVIAIKKSHYIGI